MSKKDEFKDFKKLALKKLRAGTENLPNIIGVSSHRITKVLDSGRHRDFSASELIKWAELLEIDFLTLMKEYGCGYESLSLKDLNEVYNHFGYSFELPHSLPHAA